MKKEKQDAFGPKEGVWTYTSGGGNRKHLKTTEVSKEARIIFWIALSLIILTTLGSIIFVLIK